MAAETFHILPYTSVIGQHSIKDALEFAYIAPGLGGVLLSGERGTAKSTLVRAFTRMVYGELPVTLPINATEDRVVGGWKMEKLLRGEKEEQIGLLEQANGRLLYVDEVNLLDDHIVNLILDVASTGVLEVQREGADRNRPTKFTLVGTMNPEEGVLRPQLLDRFGLMVDVKAEADRETRLQILKTVLEFDKTRTQNEEERRNLNKAAAKRDLEHKRKLVAARENVSKVEITDKGYERCIDIVRKFEAHGHRGEQAMALAAKAFVAREVANKVDRALAVAPPDIDKVAMLAIRHRRPRGAGGVTMAWTDVDQSKLTESIATS